MAAAILLVSIEQRPPRAPSRRASLPGATSCGSSSARASGSVCPSRTTRCSTGTSPSFVKTDGLAEVDPSGLCARRRRWAAMGAHAHVVFFSLSSTWARSRAARHHHRAHELRRRRRPADRLRAERALEISAGMLGGLTFARERGIAHRGLKPGNVWLTSGSPRSNSDGCSSTGVGLAEEPRPRNDRDGSPAGGG